MVAGGSPSYDMDSSDFDLDSDGSITLNSRSGVYVRNSPAISGQGERIN